MCNWFIIPGMAENYKRTFSALWAGENGNQRWLVQCTPHSLFCEKRECAVHGGREKTGARHGADCLIRMSPARGVVRAGVLVVDGRTGRLSSLPLTWRLGKKRLLWGLPPGQAIFSELALLSVAAAFGGPFP